MPRLFLQEFYKNIQGVLYIAVKNVETIVHDFWYLKTREHIVQLTRLPNVHMCKLYTEFFLINIIIYLK
jgi:hypothetical protein